jgi:hypothetical protein
MYKLQNLIKTIDQTSYFNILKAYIDKDGPVKGPVVLKQTKWMSYDNVREFIFLKTFFKTFF